MNKISKFYNSEITQTILDAIGAIVFIIGPIFILTLGN